MLCRCFQSRLHTNLPQRYSGSGDISHFDAVTAPKFQRVNTEVATDDVDLGFGGKMRLDTARTAERATSHFIGINAHAVKTDVWNVVRPADNLRANLHTTGMAGKAGVEVKRGLPRRQLPIVGDASFDGDGTCRARFPQKKLFLPRQHQLDWPTGRPRQQHTVWLDGCLQLAAKATADMWHDHPHLGERQIKQLCQSRAYHVRALRARPHRDFAVRLHLGHSRHGL